MVNISSRTYRRLVELRGGFPKMITKVYRNDPACSIVFNNYSMEYLEAVVAARREIFLMSGKAKDKFEWRGYVNVELSGEVKEEARAFMDDQIAVTEAVEDAITGQYRVRLEEDKDSGGIKCVMICHDEKSPNYGKAMAGYARTWFDALGVTMFKHFVICSGDWGEGGSVGSFEFG